MLSPPIITETPVLVPPEICCNPRLGSQEKILFGILLSRPTATIDECAAALGTRDTEIRRSLKRLQAVGLLPAEGADA